MSCLAGIVGPTLGSSASTVVQPSSPSSCARMVRAKMCKSNSWTLLAGSLVKSLPPRSMTDCPFTRRCGPSPLSRCSVAAVSRRPCDGYTVPANLNLYIGGMLFKIDHSARMCNYTFGQGNSSGSIYRNSSNVTESTYRCRAAPQRGGECVVHCGIQPARRGN